MTVDPMIGDDVGPGTASKLGLDCTIPMGPQFSREHFDRGTAFELDDPPADVVAMTEDELTATTGSRIRSFSARSATCGPGWTAATTHRGIDTRSRTVTLRLKRRSRPSRISTRDTVCSRGHVRTTEVTLIAQTGRNPGEMRFRCDELHPCSPGNGLLSRVALQLTLGGHG
jgi:hypothetical protein